MKNIAIFGATGSIGTSTLAVIDLHPEQFTVFAISANTNWQKMHALCKKYQPKFAVMTDKTAGEKLNKALKQSNTVVLLGESALFDIVKQVELDIVMAAIVGSAGMLSTLAAIKANKRVLLANKESLVLSGDLLIKTLANSDAELLPVDSEHSAIYQCLQSGKDGLKKIQLTASGGPFLHTPYNELANVSPEDACKHPNWDMGRKISIDSATMMNKGLELIEAFYLFGLAKDNIDVIIHPQSIIHSLVFYKDGSTLAQLGVPDMRCAISYALSYPKRIESGVASLSLAEVANLEFYPVDLKKFRCLKLSMDVLKQGGSAIATLNSANEIAVEAFLAKKIGFLNIATVIEQTLNIQKSYPIDNIEAIMANDITSREIASNIINNI